MQCEIYVCECVSRVLLAGLPAGGAGMRVAMWREGI